MYTVYCVVLTVTNNRMRWMTGTGGSSSNSWEVWWREENGYLSKFGLGQKLQCMIKPVFYLIIGVSAYTRCAVLVLA
jgi:hypothetical protein